jgi:hypothetical protein
MAKKLVDVEDLMVWAAAELARKRPGKVVTLRTLDVGRGDGELTGRWNRPMGYPPMSPMFSAGLARAGVARGDPPHDDALMVEDALERLRSISPEPRVAASDLAAGLGFELDCAGAARAGLRKAANFVLVCGRLGKRPDVRREPPDHAARLAANGKPGVWRLESWAEPTFDDHAQVWRTVETPAPPKRKGVYPAGAYCVLDYTPSPQALVDERADYAGWIAGLFWLAEALSGRLTSRAALTPRAALRPWLGERDGDPVRDLYGRAAERVYGRDEARAAAAERATGRRRPVAGGSVYVGDGGADDLAEEA